MSNAIAVGLPTPAPATTTKSSSTVARGTDETAPFAAVLQGVGPNGPPPDGTTDEPPDTEPGSLDLASLVKQLLTGNVAPGDQTATEPDIQPDRLAGAGTNKTDDTGTPVEGAMLVALMPPPIVPVVETAVGGPLVAPPVDGAITVLPAIQAASTPLTIEVLTPPADETAVAVPSAGGSDAPVVPTPTTVDTAVVETVSVATATDGEQQQAVLSLAQAAAGETDVIEPASPTSDVDALDQPVTAEVEAVPAEVVPEDVTVETVKPDLAPREVRAPVSRESAPAVNVDATTDDATVAPTIQPATSSARSAAPVATAEMPAVESGNEVFSGNLANTVQRASLLGDHEVRLLLNPPELGHLDVRIVESPAGLRVMLEAATAEAHELIQRQLPSLRAALEARDLRIDRLQVQQSSESSTGQQQFDRGLPQNGQGTGGQQSGQDSVPWSPVASLRSGGTNEPVAVAGASGSKTSTGTTAGEGRVDVLA